MQISSKISRRAGAFTLIELLTVIAIIAILMALLFPAIGSAKEQARKAKAATDVSAIVAGVKSYVTEYGKLPEINPDAPTTEDIIVGAQPGGATGGPNATIFNTLRAIPLLANTGHAQNPRRVVFFEGKAVSNPKNPREGFLDDASGGGDASSLNSFFDPWEQQYCIVLDYNYDNQINVGTVYQDFSGLAMPRVTVGAYTVGKDNKIGSQNTGGNYKVNNTKSDDILSWVQ